MVVTDGGASKCFMACKNFVFFCTKYVSSLQIFYFILFIYLFLFVQISQISITAPLVTTHGDEMPIDVLINGMCFGISINLYAFVIFISIACFRFPENEIDLVSSNRPISCDLASKFATRFDM